MAKAPTGPATPAAAASNAISTAVAAPTSATISPVHVFITGIGLMLLAVCLDFLVANPSELQERATCVLMSFGGSGFALGLTGSFQVSTKYLQAGGAVAVLAFLLWLTYPKPRPFPGGQTGATAVLPSPPLVQGLPR